MRLSTVISLDAHQKHIKKKGIFLDILFEPFLFLFMRQGFLILVAVSIPTAILSCFIVLKGWALIGDAISHSVLPGVVLAYIWGFSFALGGFLAGLACALLTGFLTEC